MERPVKTHYLASVDKQLRTMKCVEGWWLPDAEKHLEGVLKERNGQYQIDHRNKSLEYVSRWGAAVDIGANVGLWAKDLCEKFASVYLFEPLPCHIECLVKNLEKYNNWTLFQCALGEFKGFVDIQPITELSNSRVVIDTANPIYPLDILDTFGLSNIDYMKIDVEGYEEGVINGSHKMLRENSLVINMEQKPSVDFGHKYVCFGAGKKLESLGFSLQNQFQDDYVFINHHNKYRS